MGQYNQNYSPQNKPDPVSGSEFSPSPSASPAPAYLAPTPYAQPPSQKKEKDLTGAWVLTASGVIVMGLGAMLMDDGIIQVNGQNAGSPGPDLNLMGGIALGTGVLMAGGGLYILLE